MNNTFNQLNLIDRTLNPKTECIKQDGPYLSRKQILIYKFKRIQTQSMFANYCGIKLECNSKLVIGPAMWIKLNCLLLSGRSKAQKTMCCIVSLIYIHSGTISTKIWQVFAKGSAWVNLIPRELVGILGEWWNSFFYLLYLVVVTWLYTFVKTHRLYTKNYKYAVYKLYFTFKNAKNSIAFIYKIEDTVNENLIYNRKKR